MDKNQPKENDIGTSGANSYLKFTGLAFQMIGIIGAFTYAGYKIDQSGQHKVQWATAALALTGVFISLYVVFKSLKN